MSTLIWLIVAAVLIVVEIATLGLTTIWFAGGAIVAAVFAVFETYWLVQVIAFAVVSLLLLIFTRPIAQKHLVKNEKTNVESLIGKSAYVSEAINNAKSQGIAKINGLEWTARSVDNTIIPEGSEVVIQAIDGVKLMVELKEGGK